MAKTAWYQNNSTFSCCKAYSKDDSEAMPCKEGVKEHIKGSLYSFPRGFTDANKMKYFNLKNKIFQISEVGREWDLKQ